MTLRSSFWLDTVPGRHNCRVSRSSGYAVGALTLLATLTLAPPAAAAHPPAAQMPDAAYYRTEITGVVPPTGGVTVRVDPGGEWLELANAGPATVVVLGYTGEPYLRITTSGAEENQLSQTTYLNRSLFADTVPTQQSASSVAPAWKQIGATGTARWHDHRIHWMGRARPPMVASDPNHPHLVGTWTVHATADGALFAIHGALRWIGRPPGTRTSPAQAWLLTLLAGMTVAVGMLSIALIRARRRQPVAVGASGLVIRPVSNESVDGPRLDGARPRSSTVVNRLR
jgi:hypothetical protein